MSRTQLQGREIQSFGPLLEDAVSSIWPPELNAYEITEDQQEWRNQVLYHFELVRQVSVDTRTGIISNADMDNEAYQIAAVWFDIYLALFMCISRGWHHIKTDPHFQRVTLSTLMAEIIRGHALFWISRAHKSHWTFSADKMRRAIGKAAKLEHTDANSKGFQKLYQQASSVAIERIGDDWMFFAAHILCLRVLTEEAKADRRLKPWLNMYHQMMADKGKRTNQKLREGKGFGFSKGRKTVATQRGGTYR